MLSCKLYDIKAMTKMHADTFILIFFCYNFYVYAMGVNCMVTAKEFLSTCVIYYVAIYHQSKLDITDFE